MRKSFSFEFWSTTNLKPASKSSTLWLYLNSERSKKLKGSKEGRIFLLPVSLASNVCFMCTLRIRIVSCVRIHKWKCKLISSLLLRRGRCCNETASMLRAQRLGIRNNGNHFISHTLLHWMAIQVSRKLTNWPTICNWRWWSTSFYCTFAHFWSWISNTKVLKNVIP